MAKGGCFTWNIQKGAKRGVIDGGIKFNLEDSGNYRRKYHRRSHQSNLSR